MPEIEDEESLNINENLAWLVSFLSRRRWWILLPFFAVTLVACGLLLWLPVRYTSTASLLVIQQQVPQRYVVPNSTTDVASSLKAMKQEVLSRTQLLRLANDFDLYPAQRKRLAPEQLVEVINRNIDIVPTNENTQRDKDFDSFKISFTAENPLLAQKVTEYLTSLFINEYLRTGTEQATNTTNFLHQQVVEKAKELQLQEEKLRDFKLQHVGELPEQQPGNLGILTGLQSQLQNTMASLNRAQQQRALLQAQLETIPMRRPAPEVGFPSIPAPSQSATPQEAAQTELTRLETERATLLSKGYTAEHPDIVRNRREIAQAEDRVKRLKAAAPSAAAARAPVQAATAQTNAAEDLAVAQLKSSLEANRVEIQNLTKEETRLKGLVAEYENRLNQTPVREQQQAGILRETEVLRQQYADLQKKEQESQLATNLEKQQGGQQFRLIDAASLPLVPSSPKKAKISVGGAVIGLAVGFALALLMHMRDTSLSAEKEMKKYFSPPFVIGIPVLLTPEEERRQLWKNACQWVAASAMLLMVLAVEIYVNKTGWRG